MPWVRIDDHFNEHPKHAKVGPLAWGVWLAGLAYCNRNLTDGFIPRSVAMTLACFEVVDPEGRVWKLARTSGMTGEDVDMEWVIRLLVDAGLWEEVPGGYRVHDYHDYQPSREEVEAEREAARARMRRRRSSKKQSGSGSDEVPENSGGSSAEVRANIARTSGEVQAESGRGSAAPVPVPDPDKHSQDTTEQQATASLRSSTARAREETAAAARDGKGHDGDSVSSPPRPPGSFVAAEIAGEVQNARSSIPSEVLDAIIAATGRDITTLEEVAVVHEMLDLAPAELVAGTIREVAERERRAGRPKPRSVRYFLGAVKDAAERARRAEEVDYALPDPNADYEVERRKRAAEFAAVTPWLRGETG